MKLKTQRELAAAEHVKDLHMHHTPSGGDKLSATSALAPPVQVPGRAKKGKAFSQK